MTEQSDYNPETVDSSHADEPGEDDTELLEPTEELDESVFVDEETELDDEHPFPSEEELAEGQRLGEEIDTEDDEDSGIMEADELDPDEEANPYPADGEVVQDVQDADELE